MPAPTGLNVQRWYKLILYNLTKNCQQRQTVAKLTWQRLSSSSRSLSTLKMWPSPSNQGHGVFVQMFTFAMGIYALIMLVKPSKMVTDHFPSPSSPMIEFWIRGQSVVWGISLGAIYHLPPHLAHKFALVMTLGVGILYPWNAKFGYLSPGLNPKYPGKRHGSDSCLRVRSYAMLG
eukprot:1144163-Rhodomonas_salina.2